MHSIFLSVFDSNGNVSMVQFGPFGTKEKATKAAEEILRNHSFTSRGDIVDEFNWSIVSHD